MTYRGTSLLLATFLALLPGPACGTHASGGAEPKERIAFAPAPSSPLHVGPMAGRPAVGDVDRDGRPDLVVACGTCCGSRPHPESGHVYVLLNDGAKGFKTAPGSPVKIASSVRKLALADFDADGDLDVAAAQHDSYDVVVLLGDGKGGFAQAPETPIQAGGGARPHTHEIAAGDLDGDRKADLVLTNANGNSVAVLLGDGKGGFAHADGSPFPAGRHPYDGIALADMNGDGKLDVVVPNLAGNAVSVLLGDGTGRLSIAEGSPVAVGERPGYVAVGDFNGDRRMDVVATHDDVGLVDVLLGDGRGGLSPAPGSPVRLDVPVWGIAVADLDADGHSDLALGAFGNAGPVVLRGDGKGGFAEVKGLELDAGANPNHVVVADLDANGRLDLVTGNYGTGDLSVFLGK